MWPDGYLCRWLSTERVRLYLNVRDAPRHSPRASLWFSLWRASDTNSVSYVESSPEICFDPLQASREGSEVKEGLMDTPWGPWPAPYSECRALRERSVSGSAQDDMVYDVYWKAICMFPALRLWIAAHFPRYWGVIEGTYPQLTLTVKE